MGMTSTELSRSVTVLGLPIVYWKVSGKKLTFRSLVMFAYKMGKIMFIAFAFFIVVFVIVSVF